ncbi:MAG: hypothetical protein KA956_11290 [Pyrinomonadaceae bacterium]|nr:hypothetical protein [Acidobacteriota bacterium]MBP7377050.1 hypothetical protein [Pyrinomonadaceae bacterium]
MAGISSRSWVLFGFTISLISVVISVFVLSSVNDRLKDTEAELTRLTTALTTQATEMKRADVIYGQFIMLNNLSRMSTGEAAKAANEDSIYLLQSYLDRMLFAINDLSAVDVIKATSERDAVALEFLTRLKKARDEGNAAEVDRIQKEADTVISQMSKPTTELGRLIQRSADVADPASMSELSTDEIMNELSPYLKELNDQFIANQQAKESRIKELEKKKDDLTWWASIMTYLAVALQMFGLMAVMSKDLATDSETRRDRAENEARKAEEEARLAFAEMKEAVQDTQEAKDDLLEARQEAYQARQEAAALEQKAVEARDLLAELEDDVGAALDEADKYKQ